MSAKGEYGEPWRVLTDGLCSGGGIVADNRTPGSALVAEVHFRESQSEQQAIRERIVSCVNTLDGLDPAGMAPLIEAAKLDRNTIIVGGDKPGQSTRFTGRWVAVPEEDFEALRAALKALGVAP